MNHKLQPYKKAIAFAALAISVAVAIICFQGSGLQEILRTLLISIQNLERWGVFAYLLLYNIATILFVPAILLTLGAGAIYGVVWGSVYVFFASTFGATLAFLVGRYFSRDWALQILSNHPNFHALNQAVARSGFKIVLLTRLSPIFPFNLLNYAFGVMQVSLKDYILGSVGMIPAILGYTYIGSLIGDVAALGQQPTIASPQARIAQWVLYAIAGLATSILILYGSKLARQTLERSL
ncbi:TVP38/TMEM64 family protein [Roseofilum casamattae]|uniref:TVP38/TMEM64 family membrane protein n=1 Tax=Roseofilum casamattae BLCC-M143 TaxID=3022442 RepID=A0ABT7C2P3_9CYAN|nr:TVP38/TMEM64 family protein [Roseofilum casamattae]MDJ1185733.1 TVP38/TMEM64 family protein [Roseofilum casamattae BLCC-M143]